MKKEENLYITRPDLKIGRKEVRIVKSNTKQAVKSEV